MAELLQKVLDAFAARAFSYNGTVRCNKCNQLQRNETSRQEEYEDESDLSQQLPAFADQDAQFEPNGFCDDDHAVQGESFLVEEIPERPTFSDGPSDVVFVQRQEGLSSPAAIVSGRMMDTFNDIEEGYAKCKATQMALDNLEELERKARRKRYEIERVGGERQDEGASEKNETELKQMDERLSAMLSAKNSLERDLRIFKGYVESDQQTIHEILSEAFLPFNFIEEREVQTPEQRLARYLGNTEMDLELADEAPLQEPEMSAEEHEKAAARNDYQEARAYAAKVQRQFDELVCTGAQQKEYYMAELAAGDTTDTQTDFDLGILDYNRSVTRNLIEAEEALETAKERFYAIPDNTSDLSSTYALNDEAPSISINYDEINADQKFGYVKPERRANIESWSMDVDSSVDPEFMPEDIDIQDWDFRPTELHDSLSMIDETPLKRTIDSWHRIREDARRFLCYQTPQPDEAWLIDTKPLKRRMSSVY